MSDTILQDLYQVVLGRKSDPQEGSYTCYLFDKGLDKILKKVGKSAPRPSLPPRTASRRRRWERFPTSSTT